MLEGYKVFDADAHGSLSPAMWETLPKEYAVRRPRPVDISDATGLGNYTAGWLIEGRLEPHAFGPGAQQANTPRLIMSEFGADTSREICSPGSVSLADIPARIRDLDRMGFDSQVLFPSTLYAHMTADPGFEAALYRSYNRYVGNQSSSAPPASGCFLIRVSFPCGMSSRAPGCRSAYTWA